MFKRKPKFHIETKTVPGGMLKEYYYKGRVTCAVFVPTSAPATIESLRELVETLKGVEVEKGEAYNKMISVVTQLMKEGERFQAVKMYRDFYKKYGVTKLLMEAKVFVEGLV